METYRGSPDEKSSSAGGAPDAAEALNDKTAFLRRLIPLPSSESIAPMALLPISMQSGAMSSSPLVAAAAMLGQQTASIVSQAASVLDEEMAKGVLAAHSAGGAAPQSYMSDRTPALRQMHEFVDSLAALWPSLQGATAKVPSTHQPANSHALPLVEVKPSAAVQPGERVTISMTVRNSESRAVHLVPTATDLLGSRGGQVSCSRFEFTPAEIALEPQEQRDLQITVAVPSDVVRGSYAGLLVFKGLDYLRAVIAVEVA